MGWAKIKKALNGTLGTNEFQSLDKMILGQKGLKSSDNYYATLLDDNVTVSLGKTWSKDLIKMNWDGTFRLGVSLYKDSQGGYLDVKVNNVTIKTIDYEDMNNSPYQFTYLSEIPVKKGDIVSVSISARSQGAVYISKINMYADVTDLSAFDFIESE